MNMEQDQQKERCPESEILQGSEEKYRIMFESSPAGMAYVGLDGKFLLVNQGLCDLLGYTREELLERRFQDITYPDDLVADLAYFRSALAGERQPYFREERYIHKNGSLVRVNLVTTLVRNHSGAPRFFISVLL